MHERIPDRDEPAREREREHAPAPTDALLQLQRHAGNRAVAGVLARDAAPTTRPATSTTMGMGRLGVIPLDSFDLEEERKDMHVSFGFSPIVPDFMEAAAKGEGFELVWISRPGLRIEMTNVLIGSVSTNAGGDPEDQVVSAMLNYESVETKPA